MIAVIILSVVLGGVIGFVISNYEVVMQALKLKKKNTPTYPSVCASGMPIVDQDWSVHGLGEDSGTVGSMLNRFNASMPKPDPFKANLAAYEKTYDTRVIFINHRVIRSQYVSFLDAEESLTMDDASAVIDILREVDPEQHLTIVLNTRGGLCAAAEVIVHALLNHKGAITVYIPRYALSAGTMLALVGDTIIMEPNAFLGPADAQLSLLLTSVAATAIEKYHNMLTKSGSVNSLSWIGDLCGLLSTRATGAIKRTRTVVDTICQDKEAADKIWNEFFAGNYNHDQPIFYEQASKVISDLALAGRVLGDDKRDSLFELFTAHSNSKNGTKSPAFL